MGFAEYRFRESTGCIKRGSSHWVIYLAEKGYSINVPCLWEHYMVDHLVQPTADERRIVMTSDPAKARSGHVMTFSSTRQPTQVKILYVEMRGKGTFSHEIGETPDWEFINKLRELISNKRPIFTRG